MKGHAVTAERAIGFAMRKRIERMDYRGELRAPLWKYLFNMRFWLNADQFVSREENAARRAPWVPVRDAAYRLYAETGEFAFYEHYWPFLFGDRRESEDRKREVRPARAAGPEPR